MATKKVKKTDTTDLTVEDKLKALFELQKVDSEVDKIRVLRGELPLEVQDLEDELAGLETRISNYNNEERLSSAYKRIRKNARNGLAVVTVQRNACGGCFNKIPPQRQLDIASRKKIIVCEYCGRILVDENIDDTED
ncbi:zinc ribbon domain-containing protein [Bacteroidota bacterium]